MRAFSSLEASMICRTRSFVRLFSTRSVFKSIVDRRISFSIADVTFEPAGIASSTVPALSASAIV